MSYRSKISVNPNINVQGLQSKIQANIHDLTQIQIDNQVFVSLWSTTTKQLFNSYSQTASETTPSNLLSTLYLEPEQEITFYGRLSSILQIPKLFISNDTSNFVDVNHPFIVDSSLDFILNYKTQAPFVRLAVHNTDGSNAHTITRAFASYKYRSVRAKDNTAFVLDGNPNFVTK